MPQININLDSTALGSSGCILDLVRTIVGDTKEPEKGAYREKVLGIELVYGIAVHGFIDTMYKTGGNFPLARDKAKELLKIPHRDNEKKKWMSEEKHLIAVCYNLWTDYVEQDGTFEVLSMPQDCWWCKGQGVVKLSQTPDNVIEEACKRCSGTGKMTGPSTEINFSLPYYSDDVINLNLCGTIDTVGKFKGGCYAIRDWKTTGAYGDADSYFVQYELSRQLRFYTLACKLMTERYPDSILGKIGATKMGAFIDGVFLKANPNDVECARSVVYQYSDKQMTEFRATLDAKIQEISVAIRNNYFPKQGILTGGCEKKFSKCKFWHTCKSDDSVSEVLLNRDFKRVLYQPLNFNN